MGKSAKRKQNKAKGFGNRLFPKGHAPVLAESPDDMSELFDKFLKLRPMGEDEMKMLGERLIEAKQEKKSLVIRLFRDGMGFSLFDSTKGYGLWLINHSMEEKGYENWMKEEREHAKKSGAMIMREEGGNREIYCYPNDQT